MTTKTNLRDFQTDAVREGAAPLRACLETIRQARELEIPDAQIDFARTRQGGLLINAPTGIGKTLIAGGIAESLSAEYKIAWMWFAPFTGIVEQTIAVLGREFPALNPLRPADSRDPENLSQGDVYVSTWAGVVANNKESRKIRGEGEDLLSIDRLLDFARSQGFEIGVVVDEAHHSFRPGAGAFQFCRDVLRPTVSIMVTATPRRDEIAELTSALGVDEHSVINISRDTGVDNFLLKRGVKAALFRASPQTKSAVDFKRLALQEAVKEHREIKVALEKAGIEVAPLLMVQAGEEDDSEKEAKRTLEELGIPSGAVRVHTAKEPDPKFLQIAEDESAEALVFKMAAATGFDAPRAFVLASLRRSRDEDFGVQIIGRIMRKHRAHQEAHLAGKRLPDYLDYGYVFLADHEAQSGLLQAADRISAVRDRVKTLTENISVILVDGKPEIQDTTGGASLFSQWKRAEARIVDGPATADPKSGKTSEDEPETSSPPGSPHDGPESPSQPDSDPNIWNAEVSHQLRNDLGPLPKRLLFSVFNTEKGESLTRDVVDRFMLRDAGIISLANKRAEDVCVETMDIFQHLPPARRMIQAGLALAELDRMAQSKLAFEADESGYLHPREFKRLFMGRLRGLATREGWGEVDDEFIREWMMKILALQPKALRSAISHVVGANLVSKDAADLPLSLVAVGRLKPSSLNIYGVCPPGMNSWETRFAEMLDADTDGIVRWWHRNPDRKPWSASVLVPGFKGYYPDFAVGVNGRAGDGILLVETKREINDPEGRAAAKARVEHPHYGRVMMLWLDDNSGEWHLVEPEKGGEGNKKIPGFHLGMMRGY